MNILHPVGEKLYLAGTFVVDGVVSFVYQAINQLPSTIKVCQVSLPILKSMKDAAPVNNVLIGAAVGITSTAVYSYDVSMATMTVAASIGAVVDVVFFDKAIDAIHGVATRGSRS